MAIFIPSKRIYAKENPKVIENSLNQIEVIENDVIFEEISGDNTNEFGGNTQSIKYDTPSITKQTNTNSIEDGYHSVCACMAIPIAEEKNFSIPRTKSDDENYYIADISPRLQMVYDVYYANNVAYCEYIDGQLQIGFARAKELDVMQNQSTNDSLAHQQYVDKIENTTTSTSSELRTISRVEIGVNEAGIETKFAITGNVKTYSLKSGKWRFNSFINLPDEAFADIKMPFTSYNYIQGEGIPTTRSYDYISIKGKTGLNAGAIFYTFDREDALPYQVTVFQYNNENAWGNGWLKNDYQDIYIIHTTVVDKEFYDWFTSNARFVGVINEEGYSTLVNETLQISNDDINELLKDNVFPYYISSVSLTKKYDISVKIVTALEIHTAFYTELSENLTSNFSIKSLSSLKIKLILREANLILGETIRSIVSKGNKTQTYTNEYVKGNGVFSISNDLIRTNNKYRVDDKTIIEGSSIYKTTLDSYANGKETAKIRCSIGEYKDENDNVVISTKTPTKMLFERYDQVVPMIKTSLGYDEPMSLTSDDKAKVFEVVGARQFYDGAVWQELTLRDTGLSVDWRKKDELI